MLYLSTTNDDDDDDDDDIHYRRHRNHHIQAHFAKRGVHFYSWFIFFFYQEVLMDTAREGCR